MRRLLLVGVLLLSFEGSASVANGARHPGRIVAVEQGRIYFENGDVYSADFSTGFTLKLVGNVYEQLGLVPPVPSSSSAGSAPAVTPIQGLVSTPPAASQQCAATTRRGTRCSRRSQAGSAYCWQHQR